MTQKLLKLFDELGWVVEDEGCSIRIAKASPAGEDFSFSVEPAGDKDTIYEILHYVNEFDPESHVEVYIPMRGTGGVPSTIREILQDAEDIKAMLMDLANVLSDYESTNETAPSTYTSFDKVQASIESRRNDESFDYYDNEDVCVIHVKFGHMKKLYCGLDVKNGLTEEFVVEFRKYWRDEESMFKKPQDVIDYVKSHNLPVIFYNNYTDIELSLIQVETYFKDYERKDFVNGKHQ